MSIAVQAYRKLQKKREKEKHKKTRHEVKEATKLLQEPEKLKKELDELCHKSIIGRIDEDESRRKEKLEKLWEQHSIKLNADSIPEPQSIEEEKKISESDSSSDDDSDSDEETQKCVIEIGDIVIVPSKREKRRRTIETQETENDHMSLGSTSKPVPQGFHDHLKEDSEETEKKSVEEQDHKRQYLMAPVAPIVETRRSFTAPPVPPPMPLQSHIAFVPPPPPPPPLPATQAVQQQAPASKPNEKISIEVNSDDKQKEKVIPLSAYFVPHQVRLKRGNS